MLQVFIRVYRLEKMSVMLVFSTHRVPKSTTVYVPSSELGLSHPPFSPASVPLPPEPKGGGHTRLRVRGWGSPNSDDWRKSLAFSLLCASNPFSGSTLPPYPVRKSTLYASIRYSVGGGYGVLGLRQINTSRKVPLQVNF